MELLQEQLQEPLPGQQLLEPLPGQLPEPLPGQPLPELLQEQAGQCRGAVRTARE